MLNIDLIIFQYMNDFAGRYLWLDTFGIFFAEYAEYVLIGTLPIFLLIATKKYWPMVWQSLVAAFFSRFVVTEVIRLIWARPRPFVGNDVHLLIKEINQASFPSGHAAFYFALSFVIFLYNKKIGSVFLAAAFLISIVRIFVGVHWPSDIVVGALIGIVSGLVVNRLAGRSKLN